MDEENHGSNKLLEKLSSNTIVIIFLALGICLIGGLIYVIFNRVQPENGEYFDTNKIGHFGDFIGGVVGTLWSLVAILLFYKSFVEQKKTTKVQFDEIQRQRNETTFFNLINLTKEILNSKPNAAYYTVSPDPYKLHFLGYSQSFRNSLNTDKKNIREVWFEKITEFKKDLFNYKYDRGMESISLRDFNKNPIERMMESELSELVLNFELIKNYIFKNFKDKDNAYNLFFGVYKSLLKEHEIGFLHTYSTISGQNEELLAKGVRLVKEDHEKIELTKEDFILGGGLGVDIHPDNDRLFFNFGDNPQWKNFELKKMYVRTNPNKDFKYKEIARPVKFIIDGDLRNTVVRFYSTFKFEEGLPLIWMKRIFCELDIDGETITVYIPFA